MIRINGSLVVSVAQWSSDPPLHEVSSILCSPDGRDLVSASADGTMILWSINSDAEFTPRWMISGHHSPVKNLCLAGLFRSENERLFCSHSESSEMALWDWNNGKCLEFRIDTRYRHSHIKSHRPAFMDCRLLFCCGQYPHIVVIHAISLVVLFNLTSQSKPDWISNFVVISHPSRQHEVVLGMSVSNVAILWTLNGEEVHGEMKYEHESRIVDCLSPIVQVDCCSQTPRCVLLVASCGWQLLDAMACSIALVQHTTKRDPLVGGEFIDSNSVLVYCQSGIAMLYRLQTQRQTKPNSPLSFEPPMLSCRFLPPANYVRNIEDVVASVDGLCQFFVIRSSNCLPSLVGGTSDGQILYWNLTDEVPSGTDKSVDKYPNVTSDLATVWRRNPPHHFIPNSPGGATKSHQDVCTPLPNVTVCIQIFPSTALRSRDARPHRVAFGLSDGSIILMRLVDFMQSAYWTCDFRAASNSPNAKHLSHCSRFTLMGHVGPVTSLLHPASADVHFIHTLYNSSTNNKCQFDWDHLISGGADFTVRLWDLDPWRETGMIDRVQDKRNRFLSKGSSATCITPPTCLLVFHCHSSPCTSLFIGPPACAVQDACAGNSRLISCVGSVGSDGSVSIISLREQRILLSTGPSCKLSTSPVVAVGWRVPEDLLLIVHADWCLEIWDIASGNLDRFETGQNASELFERANFVTELRPLPPSFVQFMSSLTDYSSFATTDRLSECTFVGSSNCCASAASVRFSAPPRLSRSPPRVHRGLSQLRYQLSSVQLHTVGCSIPSTLSARSKTSKLYCGSAALVFHWNLESIIVTLLSHNEKFLQKEVSDSSRHHEDTAALFHSLQILMSLLHPWGWDSSADHALRDCCGFTQPRLDEPESLQCLPAKLQNTICLGFLSEHGCLAISFPGWSRLHPDSCANSNKLHSLSCVLSASLLLAELSLTETITSLHPAYAIRLFESSQRYFIDSSSPSLSNSNTDNYQLIRKRWLRLAAHFCSPLVVSIMFPADTTQLNLVHTHELDFFVQKWQDRSLPIRYSARTILLTLLDHLGHQAYKQIVSYWSNFLPSFPLTQKDQHRDVLASDASTVSSSVVGGSLSRPDALSLYGSQMARKQSLLHNSADTAPDKRIFVDPLDLERRHSSVTSSDRRPSCIAESSFPDGPFHITESANFCNFEAAVLPVTDGHCLSAVNRCYFSAREHARLQATAVVLLAVIGSRYGSTVKHRHPAVSARDLTDAADLVHTQTGAYGYHSRNIRGLAMPIFASPDSTSINPMSTKSPMTVEQFDGTTVLQTAVLEGFGFDDYRLARLVTQCLMALLQNRAPTLNGTSVDGITRPSSDIPQPAYAPNRDVGSPAVTEANALVNLVTFNANSSLRRAAIDLLGKGFFVWEPYVDLGQVINSLLSLVVNAESLLSDLPRWLPIPSRTDLARTAREALWAITFSRPKAVTLTLSLEVRRSGSQLNTTASAAASVRSDSSSLSSSSVPSSNLPALSGVKDSGVFKYTTHRDSTTAPTPSESHSPMMMVVLTSPAVATPIFTPATANSKSAQINSEFPSTPCSAMFAARDEIVRLFEQLCARCASEIVFVLPEVVEVVLACLDRIRLKERGLEFVFPTFQRFSALSAHTRIQKICVGGVTGSLTFFDFKLGRYLVTPGHKGPVTAVRFQTDGRLVATYSFSEGFLRIWQLHTTGLFGMGSQQVKAISSHPVPPLQGPLKTLSDSNDPDSDGPQSSHVSSDRLSVWLDWPETRAVQLITESGAKRRINL